MSRNIYLPAFRMILAGLGIDALENDTGQTLVDSVFLSFLIDEVARLLDVDPEFYQRAHAAGLADDGWVGRKDMQRHFVESGFRSGLLPALPAFNAEYYLQRNADLDGVYADSGVEGMLRHFMETGWQEGRTAHPAAEADATRWLDAVRRTPYRLASRSIDDAVVQAFVPPLVAGPPLGFKGGVILGTSSADRRLRHRRARVAVDSFAQRDAPAAVLGGAFIYAGPYCQHFGHAMAEMIHRILPARETFACRRLLFVGEMGSNAVAGFEALPATMQAALLLLDVSPEDVTVIHQDRRVEMLHVVEQGSMLMAGPVAPYRDILARFTPARLDALGHSRMAAAPIYVSRSRMPLGGTILGERYIEQLLCREGWRIMHPQELPLAAQMNAYRSAETLLFAEGSAVHGTELLDSVGHCLVLPRRNMQAWWIEGALRGRARQLDVLPRSTPLGTVLEDVETGAPIEHLGVALLDLDGVAESLRRMGLAKLRKIDWAAYRRAARADLTAYIALRGRDDIPAGTRALEPSELATFQSRCDTAIG